MFSFGLLTPNTEQKWDLADRDTYFLHIKPTCWTVQKLVYPTFFMQVLTTVRKLNMKIVKIVKSRMVGSIVRKKSILLTIPCGEET